MLEMLFRLDYEIRHNVLLFILMTILGGALIYIGITMWGTSHFMSVAIVIFGDFVLSMNLESRTSDTDLYEELSKEED